MEETGEVFWKVSVMLTQCIVQRVPLHSALIGLQKKKKKPFSIVEPLGVYICWAPFIVKYVLGDYAAEKHHFLLLLL